MYCRKKRQTLEQSVKRLFVTHFKFSGKLLAANARYHTRKINLGNEGQGAVKNSKSLKEFLFLRLMETLIMMNVFAGYKSLRSGKKMFAAECEEIYFVLQVGIFQEVLPKKNIHIFTKACN